MSRRLIQYNKGASGTDDKSIGTSRFIGECNDGNAGRG